MEKLVNVLNILIEKYQMSEDDIAALQEAMSDLENGSNEEFSYENPSTGETIEGSKETYNGEE